jgi:hypothetical protein
MPLILLMAGLIYFVLRMIGVKVPFEKVLTPVGIFIVFLPVILFGPFMVAAILAVYFVLPLIVLMIVGFAVLSLTGLWSPVHDMMMNVAPDKTWWIVLISVYTVAFLAFHAYRSRDEIFAFVAKRAQKWPGK